MGLLVSNAVLMGLRHGGVLALAHVMLLLFLDDISLGGSVRTHHLLVVPILFVHLQEGSVTGFGLEILHLRLHQISFLSQSSILSFNF